LQSRSRVAAPIGEETAADRQPVAVEGGTASAAQLGARKVHDPVDPRPGQPYLSVGDQALTEQGATGAHALSHKRWPPRVAQCRIHQPHRAGDRGVGEVDKSGRVDPLERQLTVDIDVVQAQLR
jgi:hypothetical protein